MIIYLIKNNLQWALIQSLIHSVACYKRHRQTIERRDFARIYS